VNAVAANFNTNETNDQNISAKNRLETISILHLNMCPCPINLYIP